MTNQTADGRLPQPMVTGDRVGAGPAGTGLTDTAPAGGGRVGIGPAGTEGRQGLFDPIAPAYTWLVPKLWHYLQPGLERWVVQTLAGADRVLDAGTGPGHWLSLLGRARPRKDLVGLDLSTAFLEIARQRTGDLRPVPRLVLGDMTRAPLPPASFDGVVCAWVLDTLPDVGGALREFRRLVTPDGKVVLIIRGRSTAVSNAVEVPGHGTHLV